MTINPISLVGHPAGSAPLSVTMRERARAGAAAIRRADSAIERRAGRSLAVWTGVGGAVSVGALAVALVTI